jgi:hypothetical protein
VTGMCCYVVGLRSKWQNSRTGQFGDVEIRGDGAHKHADRVDKSPSTISLARGHRKLQVPVIQEGTYQNIAEFREGRAALESQWSVQYCQDLGCYDDKIDWVVTMAKWRIVGEVLSKRRAVGPSRWAIF